MEGTAKAAKMPCTAEEALKLWDAGELVPAFHVEATDAEQTAIYAAAFDLIRDAELVDGEPNFTLEEAKIRAAGKLTEREIETAHSIAYVAMKKGWGSMVRQHVGQQIPAASVSKDDGVNKEK